MLRAHRLFNDSDSFDVAYRIATKAMRMAVKIAIDTYSIEGTFEGLTDEELKNSLEENQKGCYIGMGSDLEWISACENNVRCLWNLKYNNNEKVLCGFISYYKDI
jgi:hypothetical protein